MRKVKLKEVCKLKNGYAFKSTDYKLEGIPVIRISDIKSGIVKPDKSVKVNYSKEYENFVVSENDILVAMSGATTGKFGVFRTTEKAYQNQRVGKFEITDTSLLDNKFLFYQLHALKGQIEKDAYGGAQPNISAVKIEEMEIMLPPKIIQLAIVSKIEELFSELDKSIETLRLVQQQLKTYRQAVLKCAFDGKLTKEWRKEVETTVRTQSGSQKSYVVSSGIESELIAAEPHADYYSIDDLKDDELPEGWKLRKLGEYTEDISAGKSIRCEERPPMKEEVGIVKVSSVTWGFFNEMESKTCFSKDYYNEKYLIRSGDFLFSRANTIELIGACVIVNQVDKRLMLSDKILRFTLSKKVLKEYVLYYLRSRKGRKQIETLSTGNQDSMRNIGQEKIKQIAFPYCSIEVQNSVVEAIESRLSVADKMEESITQSTQQAEALRQSILKKAFEGKLVVEKKSAVYKPKSEYFYQVQLLGLIARASKKKDIAHGEMTIAKYAYLLDKVFDVPTFYDYKRWHLGPYPPEIKKAINNKKFFKKQNGSIEVADEETLFKHNSHYQKEIENAVADLAEIFSKDPAKERAHKTELLATVCKVVEDIQTTELQVVRTSMKEWKIELENSPFKNKSEKFTEAETEKCLAFLVEKRWDKKLIKNLNAKSN